MSGGQSFQFVNYIPPAPARSRSTMAGASQSQAGPRGQQRVMLPGFGLSLKEMPTQSLRDLRATDTEEDVRLPHAIADWCGSPGVTVYERNMLGFMSQITDKPNWDDKVFNETIVEKWHREAVSQYNNFTDAMFDYCIQELREKAQKFRETGIVAVLDTEATIVKSDTAVPSELRNALRAAAARLEDVPDHLKDWHPGSNDQVLDLLHPSLFPLIYGRTKVLPTGTVPLEDCVEFAETGECTKAVTVSKTSTSILKRKASSWDEDDEDYMAAWDEFQWLPSDVHFKADGSVKISSYVNNLHPAHHQNLYKVLEQMVDCSIPLWNEVVSWFQDRRRIEVEGPGSEDWSRPEGAKSPEWQTPEDWNEEEDGEYDKMEDPEYEDIYRDWFDDVKILDIPEPNDYVPFSDTIDRPGAHCIDLRQKFRESGLQVIFKLANIHLDPSKPEYEGGTWHVEGALNEHICATALYYYDQENITDSHLSFRQSITTWDMVMKPEQGEYQSVEEYYGVKNEVPGALIQVLGSVATCSGRLLAFPNVLQHRVSPFKLADPTKPGHRKILAMFLVDPHIRVISTANVPPQRRDWWAELVRRVPRFARLPTEIFNQIIEQVEEPFGMEEAKRGREDLMARRGAMNDEINDDMNEATVSFCEH